MWIFVLALEVSGMSLGRFLDVCVGLGSVRDVTKTIVGDGPEHVSGMRQESFGADSVFVLGYALFSIIDSVLVSVLV